MSQLTSFLQLIRAPAVPTAATNILMGYLFAHESWSPLWVLLGLVIASISIYSAGMILNDVADVEEDRRLRPKRPLPSDRISMSNARKLGWMFLICGVAIAIAVGWLSARFGDNGSPWRPGIIAITLAAFVIGYDLFLKKTWFGQFAIGICRMLNVLLGMSTGAVDIQGQIAGFTIWQWSIAIGVGIFIFGISLLARREAETPNRSSILGAAVVMAIGLAWLAFMSRPAGLGVAVVQATALRMRVVCLFALVAIPIAMQIKNALHQPIAENVQRAVAISLFSLILIDAVLCYAATGGQIAYPICVASLVIVSFILARWSYAT